MRLLLISLLLFALPVVADDAVDVEQRKITLALATEPPNLNSTETTDQVSIFVLAHVMEGLVRYGPSGELLPGVAESWELNEQGALFKLRRDAKWSDGAAVTAHDFVFAWRQALLPATASQYAFILYPLKNAEAINTGKRSGDQLGVRALDDFTLQVEFEQPCPYFISLTAFMTYYPIREDFYHARAERYAADHTDLLYNGAFTLSRWVHGAELRFEKNEHYWGRDEIELEVIDIPYITSDPNALYNLFKDGAIARTPLDVETLPDALERGYTLHRFQMGTLFFLEFNFRQGRVTANRNLRRALQAVFDPNTLVNKIIGVPGNLPAVSLFPVTVRGSRGMLREEYPLQPVPKSLSLAKEYIDRAKQELGVDAIPPLVLLAGDSARAAREAEYFQQLFKKSLGIDLIIDKQTFKQRLEKMRRGDFDIAAAGWGPDFDDPITFGDLFSSWNENNRGEYKSEEYDRWVRVAMGSADQHRRMEAMDRLQKIIQSDVVILPTYESGQISVRHPAMTGVVRSIFGGDPLYHFVKLREVE